jgi:glycosyltransferase involved in cell wall biosynthesis
MFSKEASANNGSLRILYVGTLPPHPGGSAISSSLILIGLAQLGHAVRALAPITADAIRSGDTFAAEHPGITTSRFVIPYFETAPNIPPPDDYRKQEGEQIHERLVALIESEPPDIIFIGRETFAWHVPDIAITHAIPCVLRMAGTTTAGILNGTHPETEARKLLKQFQKADLLVTPAFHLAESLRQLGLDKIEVIPNAVDLRQFSPRSKDETLLRGLGIGPDQTVVMHLSNLKMIKRPLDIVSSAERTLQQIPGLVYVIVGDGSCRQSMEDACRQKHMIDKFRFVGWVEYSRVPDYLNLADIVVMASEAEGLARVYVETQACGRSLLASDVPGAREVVVDGENGLLFRTGDVDDLVAKTVVAARDPSLRAEIGRNARETSVRLRSLDVAVASYAATFERVLSRGRRIKIKKYGSRRLGIGHQSQRSSRLRGM